MWTNPFEQFIQKQENISKIIEICEKETIIIYMVWGIGVSILVGIIIKLTQQQEKAVSSALIKIERMVVEYAEGKKNIYIYITIGIMILILNIIGMVPGGVALTSELYVTGSMGMMGWYIIIIEGIERNGIYYSNKYIALEVPNILIPLLQIIELISTTLRIISLALRLFANIVAGHILLEIITGIIYKVIYSIGKITITKAIVIVGIYICIGVIIIFEIGITILQAYIFMTMLSIYNNRDV